MTAMPQMVALFNGVGGGAVALIAWVGVPRAPTASRGEPDRTSRSPSLFAAIIGSVSFWGSNIAFGKLQEILPGPADHARRAQQVVNAAAAARSPSACAVGDRRRQRTPSCCIIGAAGARAALLGTVVVLPIGGADMPVVISLLNAFTGLSRRRGGHRARTTPR